jgi:hypothetical protein
VTIKKSIMSIQMVASNQIYNGISDVICEPTCHFFQIDKKIQCG